MATLWTICGAGRGVGKTHLALALCEVLPDAVYAKLGGGPTKSDKPANLFRSEAQHQAFIDEHYGKCRHIVVEANALARKSVGDVIIFIDAPSGHGDVRQDREQLRACSHIAISHHADARDWDSVLRARLADPQLVQRVSGLVVAQHSFLFGAGIRVRSRIWFVAGARRVFGPGLARLLESIERLGSLSESARAVKISYRRAWDLIRDAEDALGRPLIIRHAGGTGGGGSTLSEEGRRLFGIYAKLNREVAAFADARFSELELERDDEKI